MNFRYKKTSFGTIQKHNGSMTLSSRAVKHLREGFEEDEPVFVVMSKNAAGNIELRSISPESTAISIVRLIVPDSGSVRVSAKAALQEVPYQPGKRHELREVGPNTLEIVPLVETDAIPQ